MNILRLFLTTTILASTNLGFHSSCFATSNNTQRASNSPAPNTKDVPEQILRTGINLDIEGISPNTKQLADILKISLLLKTIQTERAQVKVNEELLNFDDLRNSHMLTLNIVEAMQIIQEANLAVDFTLAEIAAEQEVYRDVLNNYQNNRDRTVLKTNAISFMANGVLWAAAEGFDIPTYRQPRLSVPSGINGILAGIVPSIASMYALHQLGGKKIVSESDPNMLAKVFDYPTTPEVEYPHCVWQFLNSIPVENNQKKSRRDLIIERWVADKNIPNFTDRHSRDLDVITASISRPKGLSIATLNLRQVMLEQLSAEILKMKRLLLELAMVVHGEKRVN